MSTYEKLTAIADAMRQPIPLAGHVGDYSNPSPRDYDTAAALDLIAAEVRAQLWVNTILFAVVAFLGSFTMAAVL